MLLRFCRSRKLGFWFGKVEGVNGNGIQLDLARKNLNVYVRRKPTSRGGGPIQLDPVGSGSNGLDKNQA